MIHRAALGILFCVSLLALPAAAQKSDAGALLDDVLANPGVWSQMCSLPAPVPATALPGNGYHRFWESSKISPENFLRLRARRDDVLEEIQTRLSALTPTAVAAAQIEFKVAQGPGQRLSEQQNRILQSVPPIESYLAMILDLNGVETLPVLLHLEEALDGVAPYRDSPQSLQGTVYYRYLLHSQVLSVITAILKNEGAPGQSGVRNASRYDQPTREAVVKVARNFLETTGSSDFKGAQAMSPNPIAR